MFLIQPRWSRRCLGIMHSSSAGVIHKSHIPASFRITLLGPCLGHDWTMVGPCSPVPCVLTSCDDLAFFNEIPRVTSSSLPLLSVMLQFLAHMSVDSFRRALVHLKMKCCQGLVAFLCNLKFTGCSTQSCKLCVCVCVCVCVVCEASFTLA